MNLHTHQLYLNNNTANRLEFGQQL